MRYYEALIHCDLWDGWVVTRVWGGIGTRNAGIRHTPCRSYSAAVSELDKIRKQRERKKYRVVYSSSATNGDQS